MIKRLISIVAVALLIAGGIFAQTANAQGNNNLCYFSSSGKDYTCYSSDSKPASCTLVGGSLSGGFTCPKVPAGYTPPAFAVTVKATPSTGVKGVINPSVSWDAPSVESDPTSCTGGGIVSGGPSKGTVSLGIVNSAGSITYTVTCHNSSSSAPGSATVTVSNPPTQPATPPSNTTTSDPCKNTSGGQLEYCLLEPLPGLTSTSGVNFAQLLGTIFKILITVGALFAVVMLVIGGITYMISGATGEIGEAKKRMQAAIFGLLILAGSWLILYTINPELLNFDLSIGGKNANNGSAPTSPGTVAPQSQAEIQTQINECRSDPTRHIKHIDGRIVCQ